MKKSDSQRSSKDFASSLPTPTHAERASTLPSIRSLKRIFKPNEAKGSTASAKVAHKQSASEDLGTLFISSSPQRSSRLPISPSYGSLDLSRIKSPSTLSINSLVPRPEPPSRISSARKRVSTSGPSAGEWFSPARNPAVPSSPSSSSLLRMQALQDDLLNEEEAFGEVDVDDDVEGVYAGDSLAAETFDAIPHPVQPSALAPPLEGHLQMKSSTAEASEPMLADTSTGIQILPITPAMSDAPHFESSSSSLREPEEVARAPSALQAILQGTNNGGTFLRTSPAPKQPNVTTGRDYSELPAPSRDVPVSGIISPLDNLVFGLGGRPVSRNSSVDHASSPIVSDSAPPHTFADAQGRRPVSTDTNTDTTSVREMEKEIRRIEEESAANARASEALPTSSAWSETTGSLQSGGLLSTSLTESQAPMQLRSHEVAPSGQNATSKMRDITPNTAKRWSMNEMEESFRNMQNMLGSSRTSTFSMAVADDGRQTPSSSSLIIDRALIGLTADSSFEMSDLERASACSSSPTVENSPRAIRGKMPLPRLEVSSTQERFTPRADDPGKALSAGLISPTATEETEEMTMLPGHFPSSHKRPSMDSIAAVSVTQEMLEDSPTEDAFALDESSPTHKRRHTVDDVPSLEDLRNSASGYRRSPVTSPNQRSNGFVKRNQGSSKGGSISRPSKLVRTRTGETNTTADGSEDLGWATPRTSMSLSPQGRQSFDFSRLTPTLRSRVGQDWERERGVLSTPSSSDGGSRTPSGGGSSLPHEGEAKRNSSNRIPADFDRKRKVNGKRGMLSGEILRDTWFDDTPGRQRVRARMTGSSRSSIIQDSQPSTSGDESDHTISDIRRADKVQLFLRFSQVKAELDAVKRQSFLEREALLDALNESRDVVHDLRSERNRLATRLEKETASLRALSAALGGEDVNEDTVERLADLARSKSLWQERAQRAASELERHREDMARLEQVAEASRDRDEDSRREIRHLETRISELNKMLNEAQDALRSYSPDSPRTAVSTGSSPLTTRRVTPTSSKMPLRGHVKAASVDSPSSSPRSRLTHPRASSSISSVASSSLPTPSSSRQATGIPSPRIRTSSTTSSVASSTASLEAAAAAASSGTPLQRTKLSMPPHTPASPVRATKLPAAKGLSTSIPARGPPATSKIAMSPGIKSSLPKPNGMRSSALPTSRNSVRRSSAEPDSPASTSLEFPHGPRSDTWSTPSVNGSQGDFGLAEQDARFLDELVLDNQSQTEF